MIKQEVCFILLFVDKGYRNLDIYGDIDVNRASTPTDGEKII
jgi:hypothetical protein